MQKIIDATLWKTNRGIKSLFEEYPALKTYYLNLAKLLSNNGLRPPLSTGRAEVEKGWREQSSKTPDRDPTLYIKHDESIDLLFMDIMPFLNKDARILEIGCNAGRNLHYLYSKGYKNLTGIEIGIKAEDTMRQHFPESYSSTKYIVGNAYEEISRLPSASYDLVFAHSVLVNIAPKWNGIFKEMARVSKAYILIMESEGSYTAYPRDFEKMFKKADCKQIVYKFYKLSDNKRLLSFPYVKSDMFTNNTLRLFVHNE